MLRIVADVGNSRLKWGRLGPSGRLEESDTLPVDAPEAWARAWSRWNPAREESSWSIASVNPPVAQALGHFLDDQGIGERTWYRSAAEVPVHHELAHAETAGADRALAVVAAVAMRGRGPGLVISCGTAITVERIAASGVWQGGAIAPGLGLAARALHLHTAQLPLVSPGMAPAAWGRSTLPALQAGLFWGTVGAIRELVARQSQDLSPAPWIVWTGGDAPALAPALAWDEAQVIADLVLVGLAKLACGGREKNPSPGPT